MQRYTGRFMQAVLVSKTHVRHNLEYKSLIDIGPGEMNFNMEDTVHQLTYILSGHRLPFRNTDNHSFMDANLLL